MNNVQKETLYSHVCFEYELLDWNMLLLYKHIIYMKS